MSRSDDNNVLVKIRAEQRVDGEESASEVITTGLLTTEEDGAFTLEYEEILGEDNEKSVCRSKIRAADLSTVQFERFGAYATRMLFEADKRYLSAYLTPYGELSFGVYAKAVIAELRESEAHVRLAYTIDSAGEIISENVMDIRTKRRKITPGRTK